MTLIRRHVLPLLTLPAFLLGARSAAAESGANLQPEPGIRAIAGLEPEVFDSSTLLLHAGYAADATGQHRMTVHHPLRLDLGRIGIDGLDDGPMRVGSHYFVYLVGTSSGRTGGVVSSETSISSFNGRHRYPSVRKLPWGFVCTRRGIPAVHIAYWPKPFTRYTEATTSLDWRVLHDGGSADWSPVDVTGFVPDNARLAYLLIVMVSDGRKDSAGGFVRVVGSQSDGLLVGRVSRGTANVLTLHQRITSDGKFFYRVEPGARMNAYVLGYSNTEPS